LRRVPFFIEEFIKSLKDLKVIEKKDDAYYLTKDIQDVTIPSTIQDVIMARVDSLPEGVKEVLQTGSVIEREFRYELIMRVTGISQEELLSHLSALKDSELLYERGIYPRSIYIFKHALTQEVVNDSILTKRKKRLHNEIGKAIEELYKDNIDEHYGILTEHFIASENYEKGAEYSKLASNKALKAASFKEAIDYANKSVSCLEKLPQTETVQRKIIDARTFLAGNNLWLTYHVEAKEAVEPIANLALELNYQKRLAGIYSALGTYYIWVEEDYSKGSQYLSEVLKIAEETGDGFALWYANHYLAFALSYNCRFEQGVKYFKKSLNLSEAANNLLGMVMGKSNTSTWNYIFQGKINLAVQTSLESLKLAEESDDIYAKGAAYSSYGVSCYCKGLFPEAEDNLLRGFVFCEKIKQPSWWGACAGWLGHLYSDKREYKKAQHYYKKGCSILTSARLLPSFINIYSLGLTKAKVRDGDLDINLSDQFEYCRNTKMKIFEGWKAKFMGEILLGFDEKEIHDAEHWVKNAMETDRKNGTIWVLGHDHAAYAEILTRKGDRSKAKENLNKAIEILRECGADGWVEKYEKELAALS
jgi:tetratricopeptide (TPR) repeat protein